MKDFTLLAYKHYLQAITSAYTNIYRFDAFFDLPEKPQKFILIRHDVDRRPHKALEMAQLEYDMRICSTYYFRAKRHVFKPQIIRQIADLGHEIGYHYESLSDADGDMTSALNDFEYDLKRFRKIVPVKTIAMHGRPFSPYDNRNLWKSPENIDKLHKKFAILGEVYLHIDYSDIAYITDTGRTWRSLEANKMDIVNSNINVDITDGNLLYQRLKNGDWPKAVFQIHPERWARHKSEFILQFIKDNLINILKRFA
ncbi:MAG: hypothetical protein C4548_15055 [Desulfobacteraceae bacterium]|nr:MAG: hypothetical protein C4548_15055 [Desulfobacteraceae bacterium]